MFVWLGVALAAWHWIGRPLNDRLLIDLRVDEEGIQLSGGRHVPWIDVVSARVSRKLELKTTVDIIRVPRNVVGYRTLLEGLRDRGLLEIPERLVWDTGTTTLWPFAVVGGLLMITNTHGLIDSDVVDHAVALLLWPFGALLLLFAYLGSARWEADERGIRWSNRFWSGDLGEVEAIEPATSVLGYPSVRVVSDLGMDLSDECPAELLAQVVARPKRRKPSRFGSTGTTLDKCLAAAVVWTYVLLMPAIATHPNAMAFVVAWVVLWPVAFRKGTLFCRFRPDGLWRLTLKGPRFDPADSFVAMTPNRAGHFLVKRDGSRIPVGFLVPLDRIARTWLQNRVPVASPTYRDAPRETSNWRSSVAVSFDDEAAWAHSASDARIRTRKLFSN